MTEHSIDMHLAEDENVWQSSQEVIETDIEERHQLKPEQAVELFLYGPGPLPKNPAAEQSDIEAEMYENYMGGAPQPGEYEEE